ncbi:MAG: Lrp/AsnC family transcriptional regulator [Gammaproteobacteria bacterium]|nr:Lrp/AsnC family transcriptional regulator [Gammaproteobacteria bacterium]MDE2738570.1 Lrp/AsnC family transcriptional regulator [Paracoccaceae bacterium]
MTSFTLDSYDHKLLSALIKDSTQTSAQLSQIVHLSASQCARRKARLEDVGIILGYGARTSSKALGCTLRAFTRVNLTQHNEEAAKKFACFLETTPEIEAAWSVSGDADYLLNVLTRDTTSFAEFIHQRLLPHPNVTQVRSEIVLTTLK